MLRKNTETTDIDEFQHLPDVVQQLSPQQAVALRSLLGGRNVSDTARHCNLSRSSVSNWVNQDGPFKKALAECKELQMRDGPLSEAKAFQEAENTPLLSLIGVKKRMQLLDILLLQDLQSRQPQRSQLIARLQAMIGQANDFVDKLSSDEIATDLFKDQSEHFRTAVLRVTASILADMPDADDRLSRLRTKLNAIDRECGVSE